jgi:hypothetical protein
VAHLTVAIIFIAAAVMASLMGGGGCAAPPKEDPAAAAARVAIQEVDQLNKAFADRFVLLVATACDAIEKDNPSLAQRRKAHELKLYCATSAFDIASNPDPYTSLLDLTLSVTLVSQVWIDEDHAEDVFGPDRARVLIRALRRARVEVWQIAAKTLKPEQLETLDYIIWEWRRDNPDVEHVEFVRFNDFAAGRGKSQVAEVRAGGGFLAPVGEAKKAVDEARLLGERVFYLAKRAPLALAWQAEALRDELLDNPEVTRALSNLDTAVRAIDRLPKDVAAERQSILAAIDQRDRSLNATIAAIRGAIADADKLAGTVRSVAADSTRAFAELRSTSDSLAATIRTADQAAAHYMPPPPPAATQAAKASTRRVDTATASSRNGSAADGGSVPGTVRTDTTERAPVGALATPPAVSAGHAAPEKPPFDIKSYADTATELATAARELRMLVESTQGLVASEAWTRRLAEINAAADDRMRMAALQSRSLVDEVFHRVYFTLAAVFLLAVLLRIISRRLARRAHARVVAHTRH